MPNVLDASGLTVKTRDELVAEFTAKYQAIYGADITLSSDSPDGQMMNIFIQSVLDNQDLLVQIYNSFNPDNAVGVTLDQRVAINGIQRQAGTYTITPVTIVTSQALNLYGLDQDAQEVFTVSDNAGVHWQLEETQLGVAAGTHVYNFRAAEPGAVLTTPNTITAPITIVLGVVSVNNPTTYTTLGINEETDAVLKIRRQKAVSLASQGYLSALKAALENINGVTSAYIYENTSGSTNADGVPSHSLWAIVAGSADAAEVAQAIYTKRNACAGMFGSSSYTITQADGSSFIVYWDVVVAQNLFVAFTATSIDGITAPNTAAIRTGLVTTLAPGAYGLVDITELGTLVQDIDSNCLVTGAGFSTGLSQVITLSGVAASGTFKFYCNGLTAAINWNDAASTIQTKIRAVSGLSSAVVTGSIAGQSLTITLSDSAPGLFTVQANSLATAGAVAITFSFNEGYSSTLLPTSKRNQFLVSAANIIILPMALQPTTAQVATTVTQQMAGVGGYGAYTYSFQANNSGGSINASTGVYTAGAVTGVVDTLKATDAFGNTATATITVTT